MSALTPERLAAIRERANLQCGLDGDDADDLLIHVDHLTAEVEKWKVRQVDAAREVWRLRDGIESLHRPVHPVFSWKTGLRYEEPCPDCHGKAGVHPCGCWADEDTQYECLECIEPKDGYPSRRVVPWPCPTAALLNPTEGGGDD